MEPDIGRLSRAYLFEVGLELAGVFISHKKPAKYRCVRCGHEFECTLGHIVNKSTKCQNPNCIGRSKWGIQAYRKEILDILAKWV